MDKRGVAPLVATVLLIAFSVALGAVVMSWGESYIEEKADFVQGKPTEVLAAGCDVVFWSVIEVGGRPEVCKSSGGVVVFVDNGPGLEIAGVQARVVGTDGVSVSENVLSSPLGRASSARIDVPIEASVGELRQVKLTPVVMVQRIRDYCTGQSIVLEDVPDCL